VAAQQPAPRFGMCGRLSTYSFDLGPSLADQGIELD